MENLNSNLVTPNGHLLPKQTTIKDDVLPIIDLSSLISIDHLHNNITDQTLITSLIANEIGNACEKWGFFLVRNTGISQQVIEKLDRTARQFFDLPLVEKKKVSVDDENTFGYTEAEHTETVQDLKEVFEYSLHEPSVVPGDHLGVKRFNRWPEYPSELRDAAKDYNREIEKLFIKLLELIALSLGLAPNRLTEFKDPGYAVRLNKYMPSSNEDLVLGIRAHTDSGALTIIAQDDVGGLQVKRHSDGEWINVKPESGTFAVNIGDIIQVWSNDKYRSVEHRVLLNSSKDRLSIGIQFGPSYTVNVKPLEELIDEQNRPKYKEYNWGEYRASRLKSFVKKHNVVEQHISQFKM